MSPGAEGATGTSSCGALASLGGTLSQESANYGLQANLISYVFFLNGPRAKNYVYIFGCLKRIKRIYNHVKIMLDLISVHKVLLEHSHIH